ncbi:MAG: hypothetical protein DRP38_05015 [Thermotogae bacterium]|nr:hypothetical protein [Thermotogaceae bacterium]OQX58378.1 MAG: hypothetical protein B5M49_01840 [Thermotoga sp. 4484_232]RKX40017.1 MAG: hypothetical protein DRP23_04025 [Thermotogota bacterium]RKX51914.1 MAG: hypothetical protein DRP25_03330 [Thermotoga sp.]RKX48301.1 MAG: hypothetical protein DRP38_05015 [Thermotogota bacterium]
MENFPVSLSYFVLFFGITIAGFIVLVAATLWLFRHNLSKWKEDSSFMDEREYIEKMVKDLIREIRSLREEIEELRRRLS